jgi:hypothetical protein
MRAKTSPIAKVVPAVPPAVPALEIIVFIREMERGMEFADGVKPAPMIGSM